MLLLPLISHLQEMVEAGQLAYPYSTRELVKLVAHAQRFPHDSLEELASGVFAFDLANRKKRTPLLEVLQRHGIATTEALPGGLELEHVLVWSMLQIAIGQFVGSKLRAT